MALLAYSTHFHPSSRSRWSSKCPFSVRLAHRTQTYGIVRGVCCNGCGYSDTRLWQTVEQTFTFNLNVRAWQATCGHYLRLADARYYAQEATRLSLAAMLNGTVESLTLPHVIPPVSIRLCRHRPLVFYSPTHSLACRFCDWRHPTRLWLCRRQRRGLNTRSGRIARLDLKHSQEVVSFGRLHALLGRCTRLPGWTHKPSGHRFIPCQQRRRLEPFCWAQVHATPDGAPTGLVVT